MALWDLLWGRPQETGIQPWQLRIRDLQGQVMFIAPRADMFLQDFRGNSFVAADLRGAHMAASNFEGCDFRGADLTRADLSGSNLRNADFEGATLEGADLSRADLTNANLLFAKLGEKRERARMDHVKGLTALDVAVLETRMDEIMEHVRIRDFHERRRYALHLRSSVAEVRKDV